MLSASNLVRVVENFRFILNTWNRMSLTLQLELRAISTEHGKWRGQENLEVQPKRPFLRIAQVKPHHLVEACTVAPAHLPEAGHPGFQLQDSPPVPDVVHLELIWNRRARADERHL